MEKIIKYAVVHALGTALYIVLVAAFLFYVPKWLNLDGQPDTVLAPIVMLLLFVSSAGLTATMVFGRPIMWYLDGKKKDALLLLVYTLGFLFSFAIVTFIILAS